MPKVSVTIASYNHEKYITDCIQSVLDQTFQDFEIIIVDDGSADGTVNEINKFSDPRIKFYSLKNNVGSAYALRFCFEKASGEFIATLGSDDMFMPNKLEKQIRFLEEHPNIGAVFSFAKIINEDGEDFKDKTHLYFDIFIQENRDRYQWLNRFFYKGNCLCHPSVLIRKECYDDIGFLNPCYAQFLDFDLWIRLCLKYEIHIIPENLIKYRVRANNANASAPRTEVKIRTKWEMSQILKNYLKIGSSDEFLRIFPEAEKYQNKTEDDLVPFFVSLMALEKDTPAHTIFALNTLFEMLNDEKMAKILNEKYNFTYIDLIKLTGKYDPFNIIEISKLKQQLKKHRSGSFMQRILGI